MNASPIQTSNTSRSSRSSSITLPPILVKVWLLIVLSVVVSVGMHLYWFFIKNAHGFYASPFSSRTERFRDFTIFEEKYAHWHRPDFFSTGFPINYPAPVADLFEVFFHFFAHPTRTFLTFTALCFIVPCVLFARALQARGIRPIVAALFSISLCLFSWPAFLLIDRGNMEVVVWVATALGFWGLATGRDNLAAIGFGLAGSFKLFPFILLAVFLSEKKYSKLFLGLATLVGVSLLSLWILGPTVHQAYSGIAFGLASFKANYMAQWRASENGIDHSLFALIKFTLILTHLHGKRDFFRILDVYLLLTAAFGTALYFFRIRRLPLLNQALILTIASIFLTAFSGDGTLIHLYGPLAPLIFLAIDAWKRGLAVPSLQGVILLLAFLVTPVTFLVFRDHRFEGQVKSVALGILFYLALRYPLSAPLASTRRPGELAHPDASKIVVADHIIPHAS